MLSGDWSKCAKARVPNSWVPVRNWITQQEVISGQLTEASSVFTATPHCSHYCLSYASCQISGGMMSAMWLNHPKLSPSPSSEKTVFHKTSPWCQKAWGPLKNATSPVTLGLAAIQNYWLHQQVLVSLQKKKRTWELLNHINYLS